MPLNIDIQQILLHMLNFAILFGALYFLLYKPIRNFNSKRDDYFKEMERKTGGEMEEARRIKKEYEEKLAGAQAEIEKMKAQAAEEASAKAEKILSKAKKDSNDILINAKTRATKEKKEILSSANREIRQLAEQAAEKIVMEGTLESYESFLESVEKSQTEENE